MSKETLTWLNTMTLIGMTEKRGNAWHYRAEEQGDQSNHYPGPVPVDDILRRLFNFEVIEAPVRVQVPCGIDHADGIGEDGNPYKLVTDPERKAMVTSDTFDVLGIFKKGYQGHDYRQWLLDNVASVLGDELVASSAGLLRKRAVAWVEVSVSDNIDTPEGVTFRPNLSATTSFDGWIATTYKRNVTAIVCDNTLSVGMSGADQRLKVKHSAKSLGKVDKVREALAIVYKTADDFQAELTKLCNQRVSPTQWSKFLDAYVPTVDSDGKDLSKRAITFATNKRQALTDLYRFDARVSPWAGTAFGVLQATNTWGFHLSNVKGATNRGERNMELVISAEAEKEDNRVLSLLGNVLNA